MNKPNVTIKMVAEASGVSTTTISRFLNGKYEYMSDETRKRIEQTVDEMGYRPSSIARSLKSKKTGLIGMVVADITSTFSSILVKGINDACQHADYQLIISNTDSSLAREREYINSLIDRQVEGLIINTVGGNDDFIREVVDAGMHVVAVDRTLADNFLDTVTTDNEKATKAMTELAYEAGFDKVVLFTKRLNNSSRIRRYHAFLEISQTYVEDPDQLVYVIPKEEEENGGYRRALERCLEEHKGSNLCIFTINGIVMINVLRELNALGLDIPDDIGICGYDDWDFTGIIGSGISVISQPSYEVGYKAGQLIVKRIYEDRKISNPKYIELESVLKQRGSTTLKTKSIDKSAVLV